MEQPAMLELSVLLDSIERTPDCRVYPASGLPVIAVNHVLPDDVRTFYGLCGGAELFRSADYAIRIVAPSEVVVANPVIRRGITDDEREATKGDISWSWYIIAEDGNGDFLTIDFARERLGRCYDSFWDSHALPGSSPIVAPSFTDLLRRLWLNKGQRWYWLQPDFEGLGDAYEAS